eukprot:1006108-Pyramimonas_sp.AAC.1
MKSLDDAASERDRANALARRVTELEEENLNLNLLQQTVPGPPVGAAEAGEAAAAAAAAAAAQENEALLEQLWLVESKCNAAEAAKDAAQRRVTELEEENLNLNLLQDRQVLGPPRGADDSEATAAAAATAADAAAAAAAQENEALLEQLWLAESKCNATEAAKDAAQRRVRELERELEGFSQTQAQAQGVQGGVPPARLAPPEGEVVLLREQLRMAESRAKTAEATLARARAEAAAAAGAANAVAHKVYPSSRALRATSREGEYGPIAEQSLEYGPITEQPLEYGPITEQSLEYGPITEHSLEYGPIAEREKVESWIPPPLAQEALAEAQLAAEQIVADLEEQLAARTSQLAAVRAQLAAATGGDGGVPCAELAFHLADHAETEWLAEGDAHRGEVRHTAGVSAGSSSNNKVAEARRADLELLHLEVLHHLLTRDLEQARAINSGGGAINTERGASEAELAAELDR